MIKQDKLSAGQLLIEVLIALAVITVALVATLSVSIKAIRVNRTAKNRLEAIKYAGNVIEDLKRQKESDSQAFFSVKVCPACGPFGTNGVYQCSLFCNFSGDSVAVRATVMWTEGGNTSTVNLETELTKAK